MLKEGEPLPEIYTDPAFGQSSHWELSTSQLSSRYLDGWGYGEGGFSFFLLANQTLIYILLLNFSLQSYLTVTVYHIQLETTISNGPGDLWRTLCLWYGEGPVCICQLH
jgi:hypothetical protein